MHGKLPLFCAALLLFSGCANRALVRYDKIARVAAKDDYRGAIKIIRKDKDLYGSTSRLLYEMDLGLLYHYAGDFDSSIIHLSNAVQIHDDLFSRSVTNEAVSLLTNDNVRPYRGKPYEIVLLHQYLAFDYLALGKYDDALVEARQAQLFIDELKRKEGAGKGYADDGMFRYFSALAYDAARERDDAAIAYYQAVKAYRASPVPLPPLVAREAYQALKASGREDDVKELGLGPSEGSQDGAAGSQGGQGDGEIIVVGSTGRAPSLGQTVFWGTWVRDGMLVLHYRDSKGDILTEAVPAPGLPPQEVDRARKGRKTRMGTTFHVKFSMPELKPSTSKTRFFTVTGDAAPTPVKSESLTDLRTLAGRDLEDNHGAILLRTAVRTVLRTIAAQETKSALSGSDPLANLIVNIGTDVLADQLEQADTRAWFLLPNSIQVARLRVKPGVHAFSVESHDASGGTVARHDFSNVEVKPGQKRFLFVASLQ